MLQSNHDMACICREVPDAFAALDSEADDAQAGIRPSAQAKSKASQRDPALLHAEQILAAGSDALKMHQ